MFVLQHACACPWKYFDGNLSQRICDKFRPVFIIEFLPPPPWRGGIKGFKDGEGNQREKKEKKRKFGEVTFGNTIS